MSDNVRKKWRLLKKNRFADANVSEQNLRSRNPPTTTTNNKNNSSSNEANNENENGSPDKTAQRTSLERQTSSSPEQRHGESGLCHASRKENCERRFSNSSSPLLTNGSAQNCTANKRYDCDKCNLVNHAPHIFAIK